MMTGPANITARVAALLSTLSTDELIEDSCRVESKKYIFYRSLVSHFQPIALVM